MNTIVANITPEQRCNAERKLWISKLVNSKHHTKSSMRLLSRLDPRAVLPESNNGYPVAYYVGTGFCDQYGIPYRMQEDGPHWERIGDPMVELMTGDVLCGACANDPTNWHGEEVLVAEYTGNHSYPDGERCTHCEAWIVEPQLTDTQAAWVDETVVAEVMATVDTIAFSLGKYVQRLTDAATHVIDDVLPQAYFQHAHKKGSLSRDDLHAAFSKGREYARDERDRATPTRAAKPEEGARAVTYEKYDGNDWMDAADVAMGGHGSFTPYADMSVEDIMDEDFGTWERDDPAYWAPPISGGDHFDYGKDADGVDIRTTGREKRRLDPHEKANAVVSSRAIGVDMVRRLASYVVHNEDGEYDLANEALTQSDWDFIVDMRSAIQQDEEHLDREFRVSGGDHDDLPDSFFRPLTSDEEAEFRQWARENYTPGTTVNSTWHPVVRDECDRMNAEGESHYTMADFESDSFGVDHNTGSWDEPDTVPPYTYDRYGHVEAPVDIELAAMREDQLGDYVVAIWSISDGNDSVAIAGGRAVESLEVAFILRERLRRVFLHTGITSANGPFVDVLDRDMADGIETVDDIENAKATRTRYMVYAADGASLVDTSLGPFDTKEDAYDEASELANTYYGEDTYAVEIDPGTWIAKRTAESMGGYTIWIGICEGDECPEDA